MEVAVDVGSVVSVGIDDDGDVSFLSSRKDVTGGVLFLTGFEPTGGIQFNTGAGSGGGIEDHFSLRQKTLHIGNNGKFFDQIQMTEEEEFAA